MDGQGDRHITYSTHLPQQQVIDRDSALGDIETQMKGDFEMHHKKFALVKSQVISLREELSTCKEQLRSKDQYIQKTEERCLELEGEVFKTRKEMERRIAEQTELVRQGLPENMQMQGMASVTDMIRRQGMYVCMYMCVCVCISMYVCMYVMYIRMCM